MNKKQILHAVLEGKPINSTPVTVLYNQLYFLDHFNELTGYRAWQAHSWRYADADRHLEVFKLMYDQADFDIIQPQSAPTREARERTEFIEIDGQGYQRDRKTDELFPLRAVSGHAFDDVVNQKQYVFTLSDARELIEVNPSEQIVESGINDFALATVSTMGRDSFILSGGVVGVWYRCSEYVGLTNLFYLAAQEPKLIDYICQRNLENNLEMIRALATVGGDAIYIDDATMTSDMVSRRYYERFSLPYMQQMVEEIHHQGHKAIIIYFGGVADRLDLISEVGADGLQIETSMKGYTNNIAHAVKQIGKRVTLLGNIDPVGILQNASDALLAMEVNCQIAAGRSGRGFILSTGSPITPSTPIQRVQRFLELGRRKDPVSELSRYTMLSED